jgi:cell division control protein 45
MCVVKEGPDVVLFTHPSALTKLALWLGEAIAEQERESKGKLGRGGRGTPLVVAGLNEKRGVYVVVGTGSGGGKGTVMNSRRKEEKEKKRKEKEEKKSAKRIEKQAARQEKREARLAKAAEDGEDEEEQDEDEDDVSETESEGSDSDDDENDEASKKPGYGRSRFGIAFQEVIEETSARVRVDSFENCVVEVKKEDLSGFLEGLSLKVVVG